MTVIETARKYSISPESVYRAIRVGKLQAVRSGETGRWQISKRNARTWRSGINDSKSGLRGNMASSPR